MTEPLIAKSFNVCNVGHIEFNCTGLREPVCITFRKGCWLWWMLTMMIRLVCVEILWYLTLNLKWVWRCGLCSGTQHFGGITTAAWNRSYASGFCANMAPSLLTSNGQITIKVIKAQIKPPESVGGIAGKGLLVRTFGATVIFCSPVSWSFSFPVHTFVTCIAPRLSGRVLISKVNLKRMRMK